MTADLLTAFARSLAEEAANVTLIDEDHDEHHDDKPWSKALVAAFVVQLVTLSGVFLIAAQHGWRRMNPSNKDVSQWGLYLSWAGPAAASGALLATVVFLLLPEALHLMEGSHGEEHGDEHMDDHNETARRWLEEEEHEEHEDNENEIAWKFGAAILGGFLLPIVFKLLIPSPEVEDELTPSKEAASTTPASVGRTLDEGCDTGECEHKDHMVTTADVEEPQPTPVVVLPPAKNWSLASSLMLGDALHNFGDGLSLGNAFLLGDHSVAWTLVATTIYHEIAQELADFWLLTQHCHLSIVQALMVNFVSGFSVWLGVIVILASDLNENSTGVILAISAGVYIFVAAAECLPRVLQSHDRVRVLCTIVGLVLGTIPIGLVN